MAEIDFSEEEEVPGNPKYCSFLEECSDEEESLEDGRDIIQGEKRKPYLVIHEGHSPMKKSRIQ